MTPTKLHIKRKEKICISDFIRNICKEMFCFAWKILGFMLYPLKKAKNPGICCTHCLIVLTIFLCPVQQQKKCVPVPLCLAIYCINPSHPVYIVSLASAASNPVHNISHYFINSFNLSLYFFLL